ncbi:hypothetical protein LOTGIDRAFT_149054 [Lottia gigantea]|uniref:BPTI/Kunitz inhibitor domain-containing protein n=1 Tax=Lottia gigantea TaxID=225164 RepID=V4APS6_LOTGI|nr:hypothetical protein LOTGIDRAFT_149054 [Lottia gigantea]ESO99212.1 hypothetical protein LOTGIDRAFT_149054 [Lottia gigantea]
MCGNWTIHWYYNAESRRCQRFYYGGCDGNRNRFDSQVECRSRCAYNQIDRRPQGT